jgi:hypothetical protein
MYTRAKLLMGDGLGMILVWMNGYFLDGILVRWSRFQGTCKVHSITQVLHFHVNRWMWIFIHFFGVGHVSKVNLVISH